jgi:hypothetical protein
MEIKSIPLMDKEGLQAFSEYLSGVKVFLEYGCGSSTIYAAEHGVKKIISVDSDSNWVTAVKEKMTSLSCKAFIRHCNIGDVGSWGTPINNKSIHNFHQYPVIPWNIAKDKNLIPELVLIDGRFRVASFLYSLIFVFLLTCLPDSILIKLR